MKNLSLDLQYISLDLSGNGIGENIENIKNLGVIIKNLPNNLIHL